MKPAPFEYAAPDHLEEALKLLAEHGYSAKALAGGQSLIPMMNFRLAQPEFLVDLNRIPDLSFIETDGNGSLRIGAMTRHQLIENSQLVAEHAPLIHEAMPKIAMPQVRSRGTFGGSIAHADPAAELTAICVTLDGSFKAKSLNDERWIPAADFFLGMFTSALEPEELLVEIKVPVVGPRTGWAIEEITRRSHDFALVGVTCKVTLDGSGSCEDARLVFFSVGDGPVETPNAGSLLVGQAPSQELVKQAAKVASEEIDPGGDIHASAVFRRHLAQELSTRALTRAFQRAATSSDKRD
jgi:CO/xanthine dehydrogenase FAD-binding subunit